MKYFYILLGYCLPAVSWAATAGSGGRDGDTTGSGARDGDMAGDATGASVGIKNPLGDKTIQDFFLDLLDVLLVFALPIIVFFIIYSGFLYVTARGNAEQIKTASRALLYSVLGGVIILGARLILAVIQGTVDSFVS